MTTRLDERLAAIDTKLDTILTLLSPRRAVRDDPHPPQSTPIVSDDDDDDERPPEPDPAPFLPTTTLSRMSREALQCGDVDAALNLADKALAFNPDSVSALRARGKARSHKKQWDGARDDFSQAQAIDFDPDIEVLLKDVCTQVSKSPKTATPPAQPTPQTPSDIDLEAMIKDPAVLGSVADVLNNPSAMKAIQESALFQSMLSQGLPPH